MRNLRLEEQILCQSAEKRFEEFQPVITLKMRSILVDWMAEVCDEYHMNSAAFFKSFELLDRFLVKYDQIDKNSLQLVGITCMLIASKFHDLHPPCLADFIYISDNSCSRAQVIEMERTILMTLNYELLSPNLHSFLGAFAKAAGFTQHDQGFYLTMFFQEVAALHFDCHEFLPSLMTAASVYMAYTILHPDDDAREWADKWFQLSGYSHTDLILPMNSLTTWLASEKKSGGSVFLKYQRWRYKFVANLIS